MVRKIVNKSIRDSFINLISNYSSASNFISKLETESQVILFGGSIRAYFENQYQELPRDIDLVVISSDKRYIRFLLEQYSSFYSLNRFGGFKANIDGLKFDIWDIENTWAFEERKVEFRSPEDLIKTVFLNIDAIFYNLTTSELYDSGYNEVRNHGELDIILEENPYPELNLLRAFVFKNKYSLSFSDNLNKYLYDWLSNQGNDILDVINSLKRLEYLRYGKNQVNWKDEANNIIKEKIFYTNNRLSSFDQAILN